MGRRKIEIKAIKDDRNRSVTFLKRKGGLFKKAYELSVLCSADVSIVIFGNNKKLYEFSSANIEEILERRAYYGSPHERKGPDDYQGKNGNSEGEDEEEDNIDMNGMRQSNSPPIPGHPGAMPFMPVGMGRHLTPQPSLPRPISRNAPHPHQRHHSGGSIMGPNGQQHIAHPGMAQQNGFTYVNQYNPAVTQAQVPTIPPGYSFPQNGQPPNGAQIFLQQQQQQQQESLVRRQSMPGALTQQLPQHQHEQQVPPHIIPDQHPAPPQQPQIHVAHDQNMMNEQDEEADEIEAQPTSDGISRLRTKSRSIFTPIAGDSSLLAQHWFGPDRSPIRSNSIDVGAMARKNATGESLIKTEASSSGPIEEEDPRALPLIRTGTGEIPPPTRTPSMISTPGGGLKRPVLKVQIPNDEGEDAGTNTGGTSAGNSGLTAEPVSARPHEPLPPGAVLPPPSPSVGNSAPLSAGGSGPPNPFARPPPTSAANNTLLDQTPISALPSRFVENMLPSPSAFFGADWGTAGMRGDDNLLPSPLNFKTPTMSRMYPEEDSNASKRKSPDSMEVDSVSTASKRVKT